MSLPEGVAIDGGGVAAACCGHLLGQAGVATRWRMRERRGVPAIMLSDPARALLRDALARPDLFAENRRIVRRIVAWGGQDPVALPHDAVMLGGGDLDFAPEQLPGPAETPGPAARLIIRTDIAAEEPMHRFGDRQGEAARVQWLRPEEADACFVESVDDGWLFLIPSTAETGWLLAIGAPCDVLLGQSHHVRARIAPPDTAPARFDTTPRMLDRMAATGMIACGSAAMAFDPICGDGTALAVRQAILASAIARAIYEGGRDGGFDGGDEEELTAHYRAMMVAAMRRHLRLSSEFYATGGTGPWWRAQQRAIEDGFASLSAVLERTPPPRFALDGFRLIRRELAA